MSNTYTAVIIKGTLKYVAKCVEYDVVSQGDTAEEAVYNLREAVSLYLEDDNEVIEKTIPSFITTFSLQYA